MHHGDHPALAEEYYGGAVFIHVKTDGVEGGELAVHTLGQLG